MAKNSSLEVWAVKSDLSAYPRLYPDESFVDRLKRSDQFPIWPGKSMVSNWDGAILHFDKNSDDEVMGDFIMYSAGRMIGMTAKWRREFEPLFGMFGEFLPTEVPELGETLFLFNLLQRRNTVDWDRSIRRTGVKDDHKFLFRDSDLTPGDLYLEDDHPHYPLTVEDGVTLGFKKFCDDRNVTGLKFVKEHPVF